MPSVVFGSIVSSAPHPCGVTATGPSRAVLVVERAEHHGPARLGERGDDVADCRCVAERPVLEQQHHVVSRGQLGSVGTLTLTSIGVNVWPPIFAAKSAAVSFW